MSKILSQIESLYKKKEPNPSENQYNENKKLFNQNLINPRKHVEYHSNKDKNKRILIIPLITC